MSKIKHCLPISGFIMAIGLFSIFLLQYVLHFSFYGKSDHTISYYSLENNHSLLPVVSNQWYSSVYKNFPTQPIYAMPLAFTVSQEGLSFSYPDVVKTPNTIFGSYSSDFTVGSSETFEKPTITQIGDWDVRLMLPTNNSHDFSFFLAHGLPYTIIHTTTQDIIIHFDQAPQIISQNFTHADNLLVKVKNHYYLFAIPEDISWNITGTSLAIPQTKSLFVGLLDKPENKDLFLSIAHNDLVSTFANYTMTSNTLHTTYTVKTTNGNTLLALYPHQYDNLENLVKTLGSYNTIRGKLNLIKAGSFTLALPLAIPELSFTKLKNNFPELTAQLDADISSYISKGPPNSDDYYLGTWFGKGATLLELSDTLGREKDKQKLLSYLAPLFIKSLKNFKYQTITTSFVASHPEFGNEQNNDHHFHYGYYIRTASVLASYQPSVIPLISPVINDMVLDIANTNKVSTIYPYLRNFDTYESHSWADGFASFADGNDQESSSEAINAWYGLYLWGKTINNQQVAATGLYLYNQEILGTKYYWFDIKHTYTSPYNHAIGSIVWGGKVDFATWFSADTNMKYGIQLLPFTPASNYLGTLPDFNRYGTDYYQSGGNIQNPWGDLILMFHSFYDPKKALSEKDTVNDFEGDNPKSLFLYFLYANNHQ